MKKTDFGQQVRDECRRRGWMVGKVETFNVHSGKSTDLFGFADYLAVTDDGPQSMFVLIQSCRRSDMAARRFKINTARNAQRLIYNAGGSILLWGWYREKSEEHPDGNLVPEGTKRHGNQKWFLLEEEVPWRPMSAVTGPDPILDAGSH